MILVGPGTGTRQCTVSYRIARYSLNRIKICWVHAISSVAAMSLGTAFSAEEIDAWVRRGKVVSNCTSALSRADLKRRVYVQTLMREMGRDANLLLNDLLTTMSAAMPRWPMLASKRVSTSSLRTPTCREFWRFATFI